MCSMEVKERWRFGQGLEFQIHQSHGHCLYLCGPLSGETSRNPNSECSQILHCIFLVSTISKMGLMQRTVVSVYHITNTVGSIQSPLSMYNQ